MRSVVLASALLLTASVASADLANPAQRGQSNMRPAPPRVRPAPPPPSPPPAPSQPIITPPFVTPQAPPPFVPTPQPQARTPFDATRRTYVPRYDNRPRPRYGPPYYNSAIGIGGLVTGSDSAAAPADVQPPEFFEPRLTSPVFEPPRVVAASRGPDTYYVIPGCYAGNRRPDPQRLPKGCDASKLKTTPIR